MSFARFWKSRAIRTITVVRSPAPDDRLCYEGNIIRLVVTSATLVLLTSALATGHFWGGYSLPSPHSPSPAVNKSIFMRVSNLVLNLLFSLSFALAVGEVGSRLCFKGDFKIRNYLARDSSSPAPLDSFSFDPLLGWIPRSNTGARILGDGVRANGTTSFELEQPYVLAVGDSFAYGVFVSDTETWPAYLERNLGKRVINAGVPGYGVDQIYLRAETLIKKYRPRVLIYSFISNDIWRANFSVRHGAGKPFFQITDSQLSLQNVPVPKDTTMADLGWKRRILGYSYFINIIALRYWRDGWLRQTPTLWSHSGLNTEAEVASGRVFCLLMGKLKTLADREGARTIVLVQDEGSATETWRIDQAIRCIKKNGLELVNGFEPLEKIKAKDPSDYASLFAHKHMTAKGNQIIAGELTTHLLGPSIGETPKEVNRLARTENK